MDDLFELVVYNDPVTPFNFVASLLSRLTGKPLYECEEMTRLIDKVGKHSLGPFPDKVAQAMLIDAQSVIDKSKHPLKVEQVSVVNPSNSSVVCCSFCQKASTDVEKMIGGRNGAICDQCIVSSGQILKSSVSTAKFRFAHQLLDWHFGNVSPDEIVKTNRSYPGRVRADLQLAIHELFTSKAIRRIGIRQQYRHDSVDLMALWTKGKNPHGLAPISYEEIDIGEPEPVRCQQNGLWLLEADDEPYAVVLARESDYAGGFSIHLEVCGMQGEAIVEITRKVFDQIEAKIRAAQSYRGKVLSLEQSPHYGGSSTGITVHKIQPVRSKEIILPEKTLNELDRTIIRFCEKRQELRELGMQTKRGVMFYGPPGTGKTHTIRYLASKLKNHTTFLITAEQIGVLPEYFALARLMQPVIMVIEDADLLAKAREKMNGPGEEVLLNHLLNEMDGLKEDADILFVLSTNKPEALEDALVNRPGRIDQLIEFPKPNEDCRLRLIDLYSGNLEFGSSLKQDVANRTQGVSASFIKELMRRLAQYSLERGDSGKVNNQDLEQALQEMLFQNNVLNRSILGVSEEQS